MSTLKKSLLFGIIWSLSGQVGAMSMNLLSNIVIARILTPLEFGQVGIIMFFIIIASVLTDSGLSGAIIRQKVVSKQDFSTVFVFNLLVSIGFYILLVILGELISGYYHDPILKNLLCVTGSILFINAFSIKQNTELSRAMNFKVISIIRFIATAAGSIVGIMLAYLGYGVWSLVYMQVIIAIVNTMLLILKQGFYFSLHFDKNSFRNLYSFGVNSTLASLLNSAFDNIYQLVISKVFSMHQAGLFYQAKKLQEVPSNIINLTIQGVVYSFLSKFQEDKKEFGILYNKIGLLFTITMGAITSLIFIYADQIIRLLYGEKWLGSGFIMKLLCIASFFYLQEMFNRIIFKVFNETKQILFLEIFKKTIQSISIVVGLFMKDVSVLLIGLIITSIISYCTNFYYSRKILGNVIWQELVILAKVILVSVLSISIYYLFVYSANTLGNFVFLIAPFFLILFTFLIKLFGVADVLKEFRIIKNMIQKI